MSNDDEKWLTLISSEQWTEEPASWPDRVWEQLPIWKRLWYRLRCWWI